ncbi:DUF3426 domain-containing protein [Gilvimarinus sp. DA14]|uniref:DUF3426 domain-containing protein n=1 Tax=Gilvimarinus sp. DA14 TaxID=2956798 RepID=UPI0020B86CC9|nr:DUF3426 domain-containing protein [Gilvimarinus sp. DA14]UTF61509.1 zinc-ribbon domain-containing protein [Gilvimarinus sp. DA14]
MATMVTRCPQCKTSFRITPTQIQKAKGAVRCGSCLHIFNAEQHLIEGAIAKPKKPAKPAPASSEQKPPPEQTSLAIEEPQPLAPPPVESPGKLEFDQEQIDRESELDDDFLISDDMDKGPDSDEDALYIGSRQESRSLFERNLSKEEREFVDDSDESWAESLLQEDSSDPVDIAPKGNEPQPTYDTYPTSLDDDDFIIDDSEPLPEPDEELDETETQEPAAQSKVTAPEPRFHLNDSDEDDESLYGEKLRAYDSERNALLMGIDPVPVEMTGISASRWRSRLIWGSLSLLAVIALVAQIAWLQFDRLSRSPTYRPYYELVCDTLGCTLPDRADKSRIKTYNLVVRNHPETASALLVDAMILNNAPFAQAYPNLLLVFTNANSKPVASREFTPAEYLRGELAGSSQMPPKQPIQLSLELADPGPEAVNYRMDIR